MKALELGAIEDFPFLERPNARLIADGYQTLLELGAVNKAQELTPLGARLARLPIDPRIARMILAGQAQGVEKEVLIIAAALSVQDPRERPLDKQEAADAEQLSSNKLRKVYQGRFLSYTRMREWHDIHEQLRELLAEMRQETPSNYPNQLPSSKK